MKKTIYPFNSDSRELNPAMHVYMHGGVWHIPSNICYVENIDSLLEKEGFTVCLTDDLSSCEYTEDHRGETVYKTETHQSVTVDYLGPIKEGFTSVAPVTPFDEWDGGGWVTNLQNKFEYELNQVDEIRRAKYTRIVDPFIAEAAVKRLQGRQAEAVELETQALAARKKVQADHPWPTPPQIII